MSAFLRRRAVALFLGPCLVLAAILPHEHIHEADADHPHSIAHRHVQAHDVAEHDHDHAALAEDEGHVVWLDSATLSEVGYVLHTPAVWFAGGFQPLPPATEWVPRLDYDAAPPHGPPRSCLSLRAPPLHACLIRI